MPALTSPISTQNRPFPTFSRFCACLICWALQRFSWEHVANWCIIGLASELFDAPVCLQQAVTTSWLKHVWLTSNSFDICIHTGVYLPPPQQGDLEIMRLFLQNGYQEPDALMSLNRCRMHLHAFWLSDLCIGLGESIDTGLWDSHVPCHSPWQWFKSIPPSQSDWRMWKIALNNSLHLSCSHWLAIPLGPWFSWSPPSRWNFEPATNCLWSVVNAQWTFFMPLPNRTRNKTYHLHGYHVKGPNVATLSRATVTELGRRLKLTGHSLLLPSPPATSGIDCFSLLQFAKDWEVSFHIIGNWDDLLSAITQGYSFAVSDGSFKSQQGAAAWIIEGYSSTNWVIGKCLAPGHGEDHSSFCSKLAGIYSCLLFLKYCFQHKLTHKPAFQLACDGKSVLHRLWNTQMMSPSKPHYDLLSGTHHLLTDCSYLVHLEYIKGHQDNGVTTVLTWAATLNIEVDLLAKDKLARYADGPRVYYLPFGCIWCLLHGAAMHSQKPSIGSEQSY